MLLCGSVARADAIASLFRTAPHTNLCRTDRYTLLSPHPCVLVAAHGIGTGSIDVLLHELHLALVAASARNYCFIRIGSCGGIGLSAGTVVVSRRTLNGIFEPAMRLFVLGEDRRLPAKLDAGLGAALHAMGVERFGEHRCVRGDTLCAETFYVAQARRDGAFADFSEKQRLSFLADCKERGVVNFEMESLALAAFANRVGVKAAVVCAVLVDRMTDETPTEKEEKLASFEHRAVGLVVDFVKERIGLEVGCKFEEDSLDCECNGCVNGTVLNMSHSE